MNLLRSLFLPIGPLAFGLVCIANLSAQEKQPPPELEKYRQLLLRRPFSDTLFQRFREAWLQDHAADEFIDFLKKDGGSAAAQILLGMAQEQAGDPSAALAAYEEARKTDAGNMDLLLRIAGLQMRSLDYEGALQSLDVALAQNPAAEKAITTARLRGQVLLRLGRNDEALKVWRDLRAAHPDDLDLAEELIELLGDEGQYQEAAESARALIAKSRDASARIALQLRLSELLLLSEKRDDALKELDAALNATGQDTWVEGDVLARIDQLFRRSDDIEGLKTHLNGLVQAQPQRGLLAMRAAQVLAELGEKQPAIDAFRALLARNPGRRDLQESYLSMLESLDEAELALTQAEALQAAFQGDRELILRVAELRHRTGKKDAARESLATFLKGGAVIEHDHLRVARLWEAWDDIPAATIAYEVMVAAFPQSLSAREVQAHFLHRHQQREKALAIWKDIAAKGSIDDLLRVSQALMSRLEPRAAQDALEARLTEFQKDARYLAALIPAAISNKAFADALRWARQRLMMINEPEPLLDSIRQIRTIITASPEATRDELKTELQGKTPLPVQERCLLADLLDEAGDASAAEKLLAAASPDEAPIVKHQWVEILRLRGDFDKAAAAQQELIALPGGRTTARVQRLIDLIRRGSKPAAALEWFDEWKKLSPGAMQPWLDEARLQRDLGEVEKAIAVLRAAMRRFPDAMEVATAFATQCTEAGQPQEAERVYLSLYEKTQDTGARLRLLGPLAMAAQQRNSLPALIANFEQRQRQNRASSQPWLALAEIHRASGNDEERRRCLWEASRLRPKDLELLLEIARSEQEIGRLKEALATLETAAALDKTPKTRTQMARLLLEMGESDRGYQIMFEIANADSADPRAVEQFADNLAVAGEWERAEKFLSPLLERFPKDYRLHYLHGMALKESGANDAAATALLRLLEMHEELPGVAAPGRMLTPTPPDQHLPEGTSEWMALQQIAAQLSQFQMNQRYARSGQYPRQWGGMMPTAGLPQARSVIMPPTVADLSTFTLAQVLEIAATLETDARESLSQQMRSAGIDRSDLLVESALAGPNLPVTEEMLAAHPQDEMLHALLVVQGGLRYAAAEVQGRAFKLFEKKNPHLALQALQAQAQEESPLSVEHVKRLADYVGNLEAPDASTQGQVVQILQEWTSQLAFEDDLKSASNQQRIALMIQVAEEARGWPETLAGWQFGSIVGVYTLADKWETVLALLEEAALKAPQAAAANPHLFSRPWSTGFGRGRGYLASTAAAQMLQPMQCQPPLQPLGISANLSWMAQTADRIYRSQSSSSDKQAQLVQRIADLAPKAKHPGLRLLLHLIGNRKTEADAELSARLNKPDASADDWLVAGWASQCLNDWPSAIERFSKALNHPDVTAQQMHQAGGAISFAASQMQQEGDPKAIEASKPALLALLARVEEQSPAAKAQPDDLYYRAQFLNQLGLVVEAQKLQLEAEKLQQQGQTRSATSPRVAQVSNPYSQSRSYQRQQQSSNPESLEPLMKEGKKDAALKTAVTQLRAAADAWLDAQNFGQSTNTMRRLREQLTKLQLWDEAYAAMKPGEAPTAKALAQWASIQEINGGGTAMIPDYEAALKIAPQLHEARARLVSLYGIPDPEAAVRHLGAMPVPGLQMHLQRLIGEMRPSADDHQVADRPAMARTLARWLAALDTAMRTPSPTSRKAAQQLAIFLPQTQQTLEYLLQGEDQQRLAFPSLVDSEDPFIGGNSSRGSLKNWPREDDGRLKLSDEAKKARDEQLAALEELCRAMVKLPELAAPAFIMLSQLKPDEEAAQIELAREILIAQTMPMNRRRMGQGGYSGHGYYYSQPFSALSNGQSLTHPAVFAIRKAGLRGDRKAIEEELLPLITRGLGAPQARPARRYAELYLCAEKDFPATCDSWRRQTGADLSIAARVWFERKLKTPIDEQVLANLGSTLRQGNLPQELQVYAIALKERSGPKAMLGFATKVRDLALGSDPAERQKKVGDWIAQMEEQRNRNRSGYYGPSRAASQQIYTFSNWLSEGLQNWGGTELLPLVLEDGWLGSPDWMRNLNNLIHDESKTSTPQEMIEYAAALGLLSDSKDWRGYLQKDGRDQTLLGSMASRIRDRKWSEAVSTLLEKRQPATFGRVLLQALIVHDRTKPVVIEGTNYYINTTDRDPRYEAIKQILAKRGAQIADIPQERLPELAALLRSELCDFPDPILLGPELSKALAPVLASETKALETKIALVLKAEAWTDLPPEMNEGFLSEQFPTLIARVAAQSLVPVKGIVEKTFTLLQSSPEEQRSIARQQGDRYSQRFLWQMAEVPQLLHETLLLARKERLTSNQDWLQNFVSRMTDSDHIRLPAYTIALLTQTPFAAEAPEFVDLQSFDSNEPTALAKIINHLDGNAPPEVRTKVLEALANHQPRTFGIELVEAFLKRQPGEPMNRSFYNSKRPDPTLLLDLIAKRTEDFSKLSDEGSAALLSLFQARFAAWQTLDAVPDNQRAAATPLFAAKHRSLLIESERWQKAQTLKDLNLTEPHQAIRQATTLLDQISMTDPTAGRALLDQVSQLLSAWETANPQRVANEPRDRLVARWLREAAQTPEIFGQIMERAKELGVDSDEQWRLDTLSRAGQFSRFRSNPQRIVTMLKSAGMFGEIGGFRTWGYRSGDREWSLFGLATALLSDATLNVKLLPLLEALPSSFGRDLMLAIQSARRDELLPDVFQKWLPEIKRLDTSQVAALADELVAADDSLLIELAKQWQSPHLEESMTKVYPKVLRKMTLAKSFRDLEPNPLYRSVQPSRVTSDVIHLPTGELSPNLSALASALLSMGSKNAEECRKGYKIVTHLLGEQHRINGTIGINRTDLLNVWWWKLCNAQGLRSAVLRDLGAQAQPPTEEYFTAILGRLVDPKSISDSGAAVALLEDCGFLDDVPSFSPLALRGPGRASLLEGVVSAINQRFTGKDRDEILKALEEPADPTLGRLVVRAMLVTDDNPGEALRVLGKSVVMMEALPEPLKIATHAALRRFSKGRLHPDKEDDALSAMLAPSSDAEDRYIAAILRGESPKAPPGYDADLIAINAMARLIESEPEKASELAKTFTDFCVRVHREWAATMPGGDPPPTDATLRARYLPVIFAGLDPIKAIPVLLKCVERDPKIQPDGLQISPFGRYSPEQADLAPLPSVIPDNWHFGTWRTAATMCNDLRMARLIDLNPAAGTAQLLADFQAADSAGVSTVHWLPFLHHFLKSQSRAGLRAIHNRISNESQAKAGSMIWEAAHIVTTLLSATESLSPYEERGLLEDSGAPNELLAQAFSNLQSILNDEQLPLPHRAGLAAFLLRTYGSILPLPLVRQAVGTLVTALDQEGIVSCSALTREVFAWLDREESINEKQRIAKALAVHFRKGAESLANVQGWGSDRHDFLCLAIVISASTGDKGDLDWVNLRLQEADKLHSNQTAWRSQKGLPFWLHTSLANSPNTTLALLKFAPAEIAAMAVKGSMRKAWQSTINFQPQTAFQVPEAAAFTEFAAAYHPRLEGVCNLARILNDSLPALRLSMEQNKAAEEVASLLSSLPLDEHSWESNKALVYLATCTPKCAKILRPRLEQIAAGVTPATIAAVSGSPPLKDPALVIGTAAGFEFFDKGTPAAVQQRWQFIADHARSGITSHRPDFILGVLQTAWLRFAEGRLDKTAELLKLLNFVDPKGEEASANGARLAIKIWETRRADPSAPVTIPGRISSPTLWRTLAALLQGSPAVPPINERIAIVSKALGVASLVEAVADRNENSALSLLLHHLGTFSLDEFLTHSQELFEGRTPNRGLYFSLAHLAQRSDNPPAALWLERAVELMRRKSTSSTSYAPRPVQLAILLAQMGHHAELVELIDWLKANAPKRAFTPEQEAILLQSK